jgi:hypothetical protein
MLNTYAIELDNLPNFAQHGFKISGLTIINPFRKSL